jgi:hypothetical protein
VEDELKTLLQDTGDKIADVISQLVKGGWTDDHGHWVGDNVSMIRLRDQLGPLMNFRTKYLGYKDMKGNAK